MLKYFDTPIERLEPPVNNIRIFVKREDLNHPQVSGNKWWKLKYNLEQVQRVGQTILTFGGAYSNHIYATAAAARELNLKSIGIIRGEKILPLNHTLEFAQQCGMTLQFISREQYRQKSEQHFIDTLKNQFGDFFLIPEGGTNSFAVKGVAEFAREKLLPIDFDYVCLPVGTGGTLAGVIAGLNGQRQVVGFSVLKNGEFLNGEVCKALHEFDDKEYNNWSIQTGYDFGGYAKHTPWLLEFSKKFEGQFHVPLDWVYTAKMMAGVFDLAAKNFFRKGSTVLVIHTGGLQGMRN